MRRCLFSLGQWSLWFNTTYQDNPADQLSRLAYLRSKDGEPVYTLAGIQFFGSDMADAKASVLMLTLWRMQLYIARWKPKPETP